MFINVKKLVDDAKTPEKSNREATGYDVFSAENVSLPPGKVIAVGTGLAIDYSILPTFVELQVRPRSGLALNHSIIVANSPGTIDRDYRGEVKVLLINLGQDEYRISKGDRIAQLVFGVFTDVNFYPASELNNTERGNKGFGSTGK